jgi:N-acetylmuramoyl-L-alanine amidase
MNTEPPPGVSNTHIQKLSRNPTVPGNEDPFKYNPRARRAADWQADYVICIHLNSGGGEGHEAFYYNGQSASYQFAQVVDARLREITALRARGIFAHNSGRSKGAKNILPAYYTNGGTLPIGRKGKRMIPILTECVFIDDNEDENWISDPLNQATFMDKMHRGFHDFVGY